MFILQSLAHVVDVSLQDTPDDIQTFGNYEIFGLDRLKHTVIRKHLFSVVWQIRLLLVKNSHFKKYDWANFYSIQFPEKHLHYN